MYETGLTVAFLLWLFSCITMVVKKNSLLEKNLNKLGKKVSITGLGVVDMTYPVDSKGKTFAKYALIMGSGFFLIFFSWLYVVILLFVILYNFKKDFGAPQSVKEYRWKLKNIDMSFDELIKEIIKLEGLSESEYPRVRQEWVDYIDGLKSLHKH